MDYDDPLVAAPIMLNILRHVINAAWLAVTVDKCASQASMDKFAGQIRKDDGIKLQLNTKFQPDDVV